MPHSSHLHTDTDIAAQIIPMSNKAKHVFDSGKTPSFHLSSVVTCQQSRKNSATFKLVVHSDAERTKRYDFEAENPKMASESPPALCALWT